MEIAVVGAGAMGCRFGAALQNAGHEVQLVDPWVDHVAAITRQGGLLVEDESSGRLVELTANLPADSTSSPELILVFGKAMQTASLIGSVRHLITDSTVVLTLQNGLGNIEAIAEFVPVDRIVAGVTTLGTELLGPGRIRSLGDGDTHVMQADGQQGSTVGTVLAAFDGSPIKVDVSPDVQTMIWSKVAFNSVLNTLCSLMYAPVSALPAYPEFWTVAGGIIDEIVQVATAENVTVDGAKVRETIAGATDPEMSGHHLPSMLQDLINRRPTEIEHLNGEIVRRGREHGIPTPHNELIWHLIRMAEATRDQRISELPH